MTIGWSLAVRTAVALTVVVLAWSLASSPARSGPAPVEDAATSETPPPASPPTATLVPIALAALIPGLRRRQERRRLARALRLGVDPHAAYAGAAGDHPERTSSIFGLSRPPI